MSLLTNSEKISDEKTNKIINDLKIILKDKYSFGPPRYFYPYELNGFDLKLPFSYAVNVLKIKRRKREEFTNTQNIFEGTLRDEQQIVKNEAVKIINKNGCVILSMYCGFGKTITSINLACSIKLKTLVIVNKLVLIKQWEESIKRFCPDAKICKVTPKTILQDADFYIINAINAEKMEKNFFNDIGTVIVDEAHLIMAQRISKSLHCISPRYLIGLTATPYRPDGLDDLLTFYFGKEKVIRELYRKHKVYKVNTNFTPDVEYTNQGRVCWNSILDSQAKNKDRNNLILDIITKHNDRNFLVLVKRVDQGFFLEKKLNEMGETATSLLGSNQKFDISSRILIGTCSKIGTGFDHPKLDTLLLASDVEEYFIQYLGRCMRTEVGIPVIFDLVDNYTLLTKHYNTRKKIYKKHGGDIEEYKI